MKTLTSHSEKYKATIEIDINGTRIGAVERTVTPGKSHTCTIAGIRSYVDEPWGNAHVRILGNDPIPKDLDTRGYN